MNFSSQGWLHWELIVQGPTVDLNLGLRAVVVLGLGLETMSDRVLGLELWWT